MSETLDAYRVAAQPYYRPVADEVELYEAAYSVRMPMMLKGPTGCGKTRFVEAHGLETVEKAACSPWPVNEDLSASDLIGRYLLDATMKPCGMDGPLTIAPCDSGAICYLDEIVEARQGHHGRACTRSRIIRRLLPHRQDR